MHRHRQIIAALLVVLLALGVVADAQGIVLCLEIGGHAKIELAKAGKCADDLPPEEHHEEEHTAVLKAEFDCLSHCGPCTDIPLGFSHSTSQTKCIRMDTNTFVKSKVAFASSIPASYLESASPAGLPEAQNIAKETRLSLRAVVLLI